MSTQSRQPRGIPTGGQFAASAHAEAPVSLDTGADTSADPSVPHLVYVHPRIEQAGPGDEMRQGAGAWKTIREARPNADGDMVTVVFDDNSGVTLPVSHQPAVRRAVALGSHSWREDLESRAAHLKGDVPLRVDDVEITVTRVPLFGADGAAVPGCYRGAYTVTNHATGETTQAPYDNTGASAQKESQALSVVSNRTAQALAGPLTTPGTGADDAQEWSSVDADDRFPDRYTAYVAARGDFRLRVDPGTSDTYAADGFAWSAQMGDHDHYSGHAPTREMAAWEAVEAADYVLSGEAEADYWMSVAEADLG